ncbi:MAG: nucleoside triphosphate pyrophosphatase [Isosphaeraceae bacterium]
MADLVLASTSPYRRALLQRLGIPFRWRAPLIDEEELKSPSLSPHALSSRLARAKAQSLIDAEPGAVLIGSDQVVSLDGQILGKPGNADRAIDQLLALSGGPHEVITSMCVYEQGTFQEHTDVTTLWMRALDRASVERYVAADLPWDCAGSYKLEARGIVLFERIESADHSAVSGLPLIALTSILRRLGFPIP